MRSHPSPLPDDCFRATACAVLHSLHAARRCSASAAVPPEPRIEQLKRFVAQTTAARARFAQMVIDKNRQDAAAVDRHLAFARPGQVPLGIPEALRAADRRRRHAAVDLRQGPEPGHGRASSDGARRARRRRSSAAATTSTRLHADRRRQPGGLDWLEAVPEEQGHRVRALGIGLQQGGAGSRWNCATASARSRVFKFSAIERNAKSLPATRSSSRRPRARTSISEVSGRCAERTST